MIFLDVSSEGYPGAVFLVAALHIADFVFLKVAALLEFVLELSRLRSEVLFEFLLNKLFHMVLQFLCFTFQAIDFLD